MWGCNRVIHCFSAAVFQRQEAVAVSSGGVQWQFSVAVFQRQERGALPLRGSTAAEMPTYLIRLKKRKNMSRINRLIGSCLKFITRSGCMLFNIKATEGRSGGGKSGYPRRGFISKICNFIGLYVSAALFYFTLPKICCYGMRNVEQRRW